VSNEPKVCPLLTKFIGWPGFPDEPKPEVWYRTYTRGTSYSENVLLISEIALQLWPEQLVPGGYVSLLAARLALKATPYEPLEEPTSQPEPESEIPL
jgi:hypothetical protein